MVVVLGRTPKTKAFVTLDQTEQIMNQHDPVFQKKLVVEVH
jgi:hypothetical protein